MARKVRNGDAKVLESPIDNNKGADVIQNYAALSKLILRDLNSSERSQRPGFVRYSKDEIARWLGDPYQYQKELRNAVVYIYGASSHFRRLIQYFVSLTDWAYVISPYRINPQTANKKTVGLNYRKVLDLLNIMKIKSQMPKILTICLREDIFFGTIIKTADNISILQLPTEYCAVSCIEGDVLNVSFDFSYFDRYKSSLEYYPDEFKKKYNNYKRLKTKWLDLDSPSSFAIKVNFDIPTYALPPFAGLLRDIYDIEDYRNLKLSKTELENYAMLSMKLPMNGDDGSWLIDFDKARDFWSNLDSVLPEEVGSVLTPMDISKISFEKSNTGDTDSVSDAEENLFSSAGVSSLLFNNPKASANALALSIKVDQALTYGIVKSIEDVINRYIQSFNFGKYFKVTFLDVSTFNRKEAGDAYLKACQYGIPMISYYCASQGLGQAEIDNMNFLEDDILNLHDIFKPLMSSSQMSSEDIESTAGRPRLEGTELTDSGEQNREDMDDWG